MASLVSLQRVVADGRHNAFTDLIRWRGAYFLAYRTGEAHGFPPNGSVVVMRSADLSAWAVCGRIDTEGDDRDPKFVDAGERLAVVFGTWYPRWRGGTRPNAASDLITNVAFSADGAEWSEPVQIYGVNYWLWRVLKLDAGGFLCAAYHFPVRADYQGRSVHLLRSADLVDWRLVCHLREGDGPGEPVLYSPEPGRLHCVIRALEPANHSWLGLSAAPYTSWVWHDLGVMIHAPVVLGVGDRWLVAGRSQPQDLPAGAGTVAPPYHTTVWEIQGTRATHLLTVPSGGDCSYAGLALAPNGDVVMSYYSQHERLPVPTRGPVPADVYVARLAV